MNGNNNLNSQFNNRNNPTQPVKNKFFPAGLASDANINDVNSSTTNDANSKFISRTTWGVGGSKQPANINNSSNNTGESPEVLDLFEEDVETLMDDVNGTTYNANEVNQVQQQALGPNNMNNQGMPNNYNQPMMNGNQPMMNGNQVMPNNQLAPNYNNQVNNANGQGGNVNNQTMNNGVAQNDWMNNQPLSMGGLGVSAMVGENAPKEIEEESKFILPRNHKFKDNKLTVPKPPEKKVDLFDFDGPPPEIDEVKLCKEYVGEAFTKITMAPFSFLALFLGSIYLAYRKMFIWALIVMVLEVYLINILPAPISYVCFLVLRLLLALGVNQLYLKIVSGRIKSLRKHNPKKNQYELTNKAHKKGGTSSLMAILFAIGYVVFFAAIGATFNYKSLFDLLPKNDEPVINESSKGVTGFNGDFTYDSYNVLDNYKINIPSVFTKQGNNFTYVYTAPLPSVPDDSKEENNEVQEGNEEEKPKEEQVVYSKNRCTLSFNAVTGYKDEEDLMKSIAYYYTHNENEEIPRQANNQINWYVFNTEKVDEKRYFRLTKKDDKLILFDYKMEYEDENMVCENLYNDIFNSITLK